MNDRGNIFESTQREKESLLLVAILMQPQAHGQKPSGDAATAVDFDGEQIAAMGVDGYASASAVHLHHPRIAIVSRHVFWLVCRIEGDPVLFAENRE